MDIMSFFGRKKDKDKKTETVPKLPKKEDTIIGENVTIDGTISGSDSVFISGQMKGEIKLNADLNIKKSGSIEAEIESRNLTVSGKIKGDSKIKEKTTLLSNANITGNISTPRLVVENGAIFNGNCEMNPSFRSTPSKTTENTKKK